MMDGSNAEIDEEEVSEDVTEIDGMSEDEVVNEETAASELPVDDSEIETP
jgi:hypothetical protein